MSKVSSWKACSSEIKDVVTHMLYKTKEILKDDFIGFYLHGSLAMGGFNSKSSDIDVLAITNKTMTVETKREFAQLFLNYSNKPFPVEISFVNMDQLRKWTHPCPFDFHYSEFWRERYQDDLSKETYQHLNGELRYDADLAAHITIVNLRGICLEGPAIDEVFPLVPRPHYLSSIMSDFQECLKDPVYCTLNSIRVYWYLKEGIISSKQEAGNWGLSSLPKEFNLTIQKMVNSYTDEKEIYDLEKSDLIALRNYIDKNVQGLFHCLN